MIPNREDRDSGIYADEPKQVSESRKVARATARFIDGKKGKTTYMELLFVALKIK